MAKSFDTQFRELVLAVALCDVENVRRILSSEWYEKNTIKIMGKGRNVGFIEQPLTIHNVAQCWNIILKTDNKNPDFLAQYNGEIERLYDNNKEILELLSHKFTGASDNIHFKQYADCIPYGVMDADDYQYEKDELKEHKLRQIDEELVLSLCTYDLENFENFIRYGANPWASIGDDDSVWERIVTRNTSCTHDLLHDVLRSKKRINLPELLSDIISVAGYECFDRLLQSYVPFESEVKNTPIKTLPRIVYSSGQYFDSIELELTYDPDTDETTCINTSRMFADSKVSIPKKAIKSLLSPDSVERFMDIELKPADIFVLDGGSYSMKMIDAQGNIKVIECDDSDIKQVPHIVFLEKYAKTIRKESGIQLR